MNPVRPSPAPAFPPTGQTRPSEATRSAQRAFFELAAGKAQAAAPAPPRITPAVLAPAAEVRPTVKVQEASKAAAGAPARPMRPGSILDIRV